jgi:hypothetical protein
MKICNKCKKLKEKTMFSPSSRTMDKYNRVCRECINEKDAKRRKEKDFYKQFEII